MQESYVDRADFHIICVKLTFITPKAVSTGGPGSALLSYLVLGVFVYTVVITL